MIVSLAWRNMWRQPRRTVLSASAVALTGIILVFLPALQLGSYQAMITASISVLDGVAQIQRTAYLDEPSLRESFLPTASMQQSIQRQMPGVTLVKRANGFALLSTETRSRGAQIVGVDASQEAQVSRLPNNILQGRYLSARDVETNDEIVLGETLAKNLKVGVGDRVTLLGAGRDGSLAVDVLRVVGIVTSGFKQLDRQLAQIPLSRFDATFSMEQHIHAWVIADSAKRLLRRYPVALHSILQQSDLALRDWRAMQPALLNAIKLDISSALAMYAILIVVIVFSLLNSGLMSVLARTREFGVLLALGVQPKVLGKIVWCESLLVSFLGLGIGLIVGVAISYYFQRVGITFSGAEAVFREFGLTAILYPRLSAVSVLLGPACIAISVSVAGLYPVWRISKLEIVPAMRKPS
ncbi:MAG: FtsX-like permease family protein [Gammaproteobacteria bacterium]